LQTSEGSFVKKSAASMLSGKRPAPAAVNFFYFFLFFFLSFTLNFAQRDIITMMVPDCAIVLFVRLLTKRQRRLNQGLARKEMVLGGQNLQEQLNHLRMLR
jgi:Ca2+/Na+ antiporter